MAEAIETMFPGVKFWVGPPVDNGFYYDVDLGDQAITEEDLRKLEVKMAELAKQNNSYVRKEIRAIDGSGAWLHECSTCPESDRYLARLFSYI